MWLLSGKRRCVCVEKISRGCCGCRGCRGPWVLWAVRAAPPGGRLFLPVNSGFSARCWDINEKAFEGHKGVVGRKVPEGEAVPLF